MRFIKVSIFVMIMGITFACNSSAPKTEAKVAEKSCVSDGCGSTGCCGNSTQEKVVFDDISNTKVQVYYFHGTRRCATCQAVEDVAKETVNQNFLDQVGFLSVNREDENELTEKFKITGQTLLIVCGDKVVDLTSEAFLNARTNPDKLTEKLVSTIKPLL